MPNPPRPKEEIVGYIDLEPKWADLCRIAQRIPKITPELMPACEVADVVRQAQKKGKSGVLFKFANKTAPPTITELK